MTALSILLVLASTLHAAENEPQSETFESQHEIRIGQTTVSYVATAGTMLMKNNEGEAIAQFGYTAYVRRGGDARSRPLLFAYNGGPGSASVWLHMGILGPARTVVVDAGFSPNGPFKWVENEYSILDVADLVMIDPVGTGYSRPVGKGKGEDFWGVDQDISSVSDFIVKYVTENGRWASPKYVLGESYGGMRTGGVAYALLTRSNMALSGVILVSPFMDFVAGNASLHTNLPHVLSFTTYAATAWYHRVIADRPESLQSFLKEAEAFAADVYAKALFKGNRLVGEERKKVLEGMERFTGIRASYWDRANLRMAEGQFAKELLRHQGETAGRIDSRFKGDGINHIAESFTYDPFFPSVGPSFVATFLDYYRNTLRVDLERKYVVSGGLWRSWDHSHQHPGDRFSMPVANTAVDLAHTLTRSPGMRVLVQQGYYDLATPYGATDYAIDQMEITPAARERVITKYYEAGHMMYIHPPSMAQYKKDLAEFILAGRQRSRPMSD